MSDLESIFHRALELSDSARSTYLDEACGDNLSLRKEIEDLLAADDKAATFMADLENQLHTVLKHHQETGTQIGRYRIDRKIASGGMGSVYQAWDSRLNRDVALKFLHPHCALEANAKQRFVREARAVSALNHPHICTVFDVAETDTGEQYIVMELCSGNRLDEVITNGELNYQQVFTLAMQLCGALGKAHEGKILHRDLKPQNVIVGSDGNLKLLDFGIAKDVGTAASATSRALGTVAYMSPEQFTAGTQDQRADIWAFGILLFEMLTGRTPYRGESQPEVMRAIFNQQRPSLRSLGSELPDSFERFFDCCLHREIEQRFGDMSIVAAELAKLRNQLAELSLLDKRPNRELAANERPTLGHSSRNERRQITILHFKIVLPPNLDPEEQLVIADQIKEIFSKIIRRFGAYQYASTPTDYVAYFGYPSAEEQGVTQAVRCALALKEASLRRQQLPNSHTFSVQIAVHTGLMIARHRDISNDLELVGDAPSVAQNLNFNAAVNQVLISPHTEELVRGFFATNGIKTNTGPAFEVLSESTAKSKFDVAVVTGLSPLAGRIHELGMLADAWQQTIEGDPRVIAISGEPGIGKSRLVYELKEIAAANADAWLVECQCSQYETNSSLYPFLSYFQQDVLQFTEHLSLSEKESRIEGFLTEYDFSDEDFRVLRAFFIGEIDPSETELVSPEQRQRKVFAGLRRLLSQRARFQPVLVIIEDMHWADPSTNLMIELMLQNGFPAGVMFVMTFRPNFKPRWLSTEVVTRLVLQRLNKQDSEKLIDSLSNKGIVNFSLRENLLDKTDGNPLFVETLTRTIVESGADYLDDIPTSLQASLTARLDQLGEAKTVAQYAAVIGRDFSVGLLHTCLGNELPVIERLLQQLVEAQLISAPTGTSDSYRFKHALIRDAAYNSLLKSDKSEIHRVIAETLAKNPHESAAKLAHHYNLAGVYIKAALGWLDAAKNSLRNGAANEAMTLCELGLSATDKSESGEQLNRTKTDLLLTRGAATIATRGYTHRAVESSYAEALELADVLDSNEKRFSALFGAAAVDVVCGKHRRALNIAHRLVVIAEHEANDDFLVEAYMVKGLVEFFVGEFMLARESFSRAIEMYAMESHGRHAVDYGQDPKMIALGHLSWLEFILGNPAVAIETALNAVAHARGLNHQFSLTYALVYLGATLLFAERVDAASDALNEALEICAKNDIRGVETLARIFKALVELSHQPNLDAIHNLEQLIETYERTGAKIYLPAWRTDIGFAYLKIGEPKQAEKNFRQAHAEMQTFDERWYAYPLMRLQAQLAIVDKVPSRVDELTTDCTELVNTTNCLGWARQTRFNENNSSI